RAVLTNLQNVLLQTAVDGSRVNGLRCAVSFVDGMCSHFAKTICIDLRASVFSQKYTCNVGNAGSLVGLVHVHLVYEKLHVTVELKGVRLMGNGYVPTVPSTLTAMILIPRHRDSGNMEGFSTEPVDVRCLNNICKHRLPQDLI